MPGYGQNPFGTAPYGDSASGITGTGSGEQVAQTAHGSAMWFLPAVHRSRYIAPPKIEDIYGEGEGRQKRQSGHGQAFIEFIGSGAGVQAAQAGHGIAQQVLDITGSGQAEQWSQSGRGQAEMIDVELELIAAALMAAA